MFKLREAGIKTQREIQDLSDEPSPSKTPHRLATGYLLELLIILLMSALLFCGTFWQIFFQRPVDFSLFQPEFSDAAKYQCYALVFWYGSHGIDSLPAKQCEFLQTNAPPSVAQRWRAKGYPSFLVHYVESQHASQPFHTLPYEYPLLAIVPFTLSLAVPTPWYQIAFEVLMALVAIVVYLVLRQYRSLEAAIVFVVYLVVGNWATAAGRFDLVPSALTLGALILAAKSKWRWAFLLLALATLSKFYTLVLVVPFLLAQQIERHDKWYSWRRWDGLAVFAATCAAVMSASFLLSVQDTLAPLSYFRYRPVQIESLPAVLMWIGTFFHRGVYYMKSFGSINAFGSLEGKVSLLSTVGTIAGLLYTFWLQWRGKLDLFASSLLTLLVTIVVGKIFSPQYLIWVTPLIAYIGKGNWKWLLSWGAVGALSSYIYPFLYNVLYNLTVPYLPAFYPLVLARDALMLGIVLTLLYQATRKSLVVRS